MTIKRVIKRQLEIDTSELADFMIECFDTRIDYCSHYDDGNMFDAFGDDMEFAKQIRASVLIKTIDELLEKEGLAVHLELTK